MLLKHNGMLVGNGVHHRFELVYVESGVVNSVTICCPSPVSQTSFQAPGNSQEPDFSMPEPGQVRISDVCGFEGRKGPLRSERQAGVSMATGAVPFRHQLYFTVVTTRNSFFLPSGALCI